MKTTFCTIAFLSIVILINAQSPPDIYPAFYNFVHEPGETTFFNLSSVYDPGGTVEELGESDILEDCSFEWYFVESFWPDPENLILLSTDFEIPPPCTFWETVCAGEYLIELRITHNPSGKIFIQRAPVHVGLLGPCNGDPGEGAECEYTGISLTDSDTWGIIMLVEEPHYHRPYSNCINCACQVCQPFTCTGDLNFDGVVNTVDLLLFMSSYGNMCE